VKYQVAWRPSALREMRRIDRQDQRRIGAAVAKLADDPRPPNSRNLVASESGTYRLRVGTYRVIYMVEDEIVLVTVLRVGGHEVYRQR
jgi:mRNA interferase RelE/StbE